MLLCQLWYNHCFLMNLYGFALIPVLCSKVLLSFEISTTSLSMIQGRI
ncbi:MAG: hypothetical protein Q7U35_07365 [Methanobacteriaceae archaeon]|nr:hypothetical protein [Methanobacteriaceae archaeon]